jgi:hypothetical protein
MVCFLSVEIRFDVFVLCYRFMQLDLGHLEVHNTFEWHGGGKEFPSAVHLDVLHAEVRHHIKNWVHIPSSDELIYFLDGFDS